MSDKVSTLEEDEYGEDVDSEHFSSRGEVASQVFPMSERTLVRFLLHFASSQTLALVTNKKMAPPPPPWRAVFLCDLELLPKNTNSGTRRRIDIFQKRKMFRIEFPEILAWFQTPQTVSRPSRPDFQPRKTNSGSRRPIEILKERKMITIEFPRWRKSSAGRRRTFLGRIGKSCVVLKTNGSWTVVVWSRSVFVGSGYLVLLCQSKMWYHRYGTLKVFGWRWVIGPNDMF